MKTFAQDSEISVCNLSYLCLSSKKINIHAIMRIFPFFLTLIFFGLFSSAYAGPGDTTVVHTFRFDTNMRAGVFNFPDIVGKKYEKILMLYSMRCKNGLISTQSLPNQGCGEWDYNCYTYVVDSSQNDSLLRKANRYKISDFNGNNYPYSNQPVYNIFN